MDAIRPLDEDQALGDRVRFDVGDELLDIGVDLGLVSQLFPPVWSAEIDLDRGRGGRGELLVELLVRLVAGGAELIHVAEDDDAWSESGLDSEEVGERRAHARGIGIVGVGDDLIAPLGVNELRATVARTVAGERLIDLVGGYIEVEPDSDGGKGIGQIVVADELGLYFPWAHL